MGARLVCSAAQVLEEVGRLGEDLTEPPRAPPGPRDGLEGLARSVLDSVPVRRAVAPERIARSAGVAVLEVLRVLPALELQDLVELTPDGWRLSSAERRASAQR
ncbi:MAG: hypothetical protein WKF47_16170 [Geodermatophilaceae bacterium]